VTFYVFTIILRNHYHLMKKHLFITFLAIFLIIHLKTSSQNIKQIQVFFDTDSSKIGYQEVEKLKSFITSLDSVTISGISIFGYCDDVGDVLKNKILSEKRANFISDLMIQSNLKKEIITICEGKGELQLLNKKNNEKERAQNRRAEIEITFIKKEKPYVVIEENKTTEIENPILSDDQKVGDIIVLENILFVGNHHILLPESYDDLVKLNTLLLEKKKYHVCILGHICCIAPGSDGVDLGTGIKNLSIARAKVIYDYLIKNGVDESRLSYKGLKADFPTGKGSKQDRRVEIQITKISLD
jgi:outer membrane protein OmpA-like peptidoglycan-associated protein